MDDYREEPLICRDCGQPTWGALEGAYIMGDDVTLCWECAEQRGGEYDSETDRWVVPPTLLGIHTPLG